MALYENGILVSGANTLPKMTLAEYQALPVSERPTYWERTDLNYNNIPSSQVTYKNGSVEDALDNRIPITASSDGGVVFTVSRILVQKYSDSVMRVIFYDDDTSHTYKNAICYFDSTTFTPR